MPTKPKIGLKLGSRSIKKCRIFDNQIPLMKLFKTLLIIILCHFSVYAQQVAITFDDMPCNAYPASLSQEQLYFANTQLVSIINQEKIPVTAFVCGTCRGDTLAFRSYNDLMKYWILSPYVNFGNHSFSHLNYGTTGYDNFNLDVLKNMNYLKRLAPKKRVQYFRYPFNALGVDSLSQEKMIFQLSRYQLKVAPFTIESSDYIFDAIYTNYLLKGDTANADRIAKMYIQYTLSCFDYFGQLSKSLYNRNIKHIFLGHANLLHSHYLVDLIDALRKSGYSFISFNEAMADEVYQSKNYYYKNEGISWMFRWIKNPSKRNELLKKSPDPSKEILELYKNLSKK